MNQSTKRLTTFDEVSREINALINAINTPQQSIGYGATGKDGDSRLTFDDDGQVYFEMKGRNGWFTTFTGAVVEKPAKGRPYPYFPYLEVENFFAHQFTIRQLNARNGDDIFSDYGIVESVTSNTVTFKDQSNYNLCSFAVDDKIVTRRIKSNKSLDIKYVKATVTAVSGRTVTVTYTSTDKFEIGDVVARVGNATDSTRQDSVYITTNSTYSPYLAIYDNINSFDTVGSPTTAWTTATPKVLIGNGKSLNVAYTHGVYIGAGGEFRVSPSATVDGVVTHTPTYTSGTTFPVSPVATDWHFYTKTPPDSPYKTNTWYKYSGSVWEELGLLGTYIDGTGVYTGTVLANQVIAGDLIGFIIKGNSNPAVNGGIYIDQDELDLYNGGTVGVDDFLFKIWNDIVPVMTWSSTAFGIGVSLQAYQDASTGGISSSGSFNVTRNFYIGGYGSQKFEIDASGNIVKLNNITYSFPSVAPTLNQVLTCTNATGGVLGWSTPSSMTYPGAGIALSTGSAWGTSITDNSTNWNTAYGWGNHASAGYLTSQNWTASAVSAIGGSLTNTAGTLSVTGYNPSNWDTAFGWGNHASAGYLTTATEGWRTTDVTALGNGIGVTTGTIAVKASGGLGFSGGDVVIDYAGAQSASGSTKGFLTSTDWNTFNGKANAFTGVTTSPSIQFTDAGANDHTIVITNGVITSWEIL